jgi:[ribosomal protein S18]-alanine N-acetyltransferase
MAQADAEAVAGWRYPEPFSFYDWPADEDDLAELLDAELRGEAYFAVEDDEGSLVGHFSFRPDGRTLVIGLGLSPRSHRPRARRALPCRRAGLRAAALRAG